MTPRRLVSMLCAVGACLLLAVPMYAAGGTIQKDIVRVTVDPSAITVEPETELDNGRIRLLNPEGLEIVRDFKGGFGQVTVDELANEVEGLSLDGCWTYEIVGTPSLTKTEQALLAESRETGRPAPLALQQKLQNSNQSGSFMVKEGRMFLEEGRGEGDVDGKLRAEVPNGMDHGLGISAETPTGLDHQIISGDAIVYNSICVGFDCPTNPSFGADTIRLQENNLRIHFDDTSTAASFPNRDWRIVANDQANGGADKFTIQDASANRNVFTIEGAAPSNSLYVDDGGRVGMGTSTPVLEIHAVDGDTPALRLEQDGSSGFQPQTWDVAGNETSFFVRDATNGSTLPFRIFPGESSNSLVIRNDGVGVGTLSPSEALHVVGTDDPKVLIEDTSNNANDKPGFTLRSPAAASSGDWRFEVANTGNFQIDFVPSTGPEILVSDSTTGNSTVTINGDLMVNGLCTGCDAVFQPDFELESIEEHAAIMWEQSHLPAVGPTPEGKGPINVFEKTTGILQELEKAHIYIDQLNSTIQDLRAELNEKDEDVVTLSERLAVLEDAMRALQQ